MDYERLKKKFETMKGLTIEEKAKKYSEALERAKKLQETCDSTAVVGWCEYIFPELKESESERIMEDLIEFFEEFPDMIWRGHYKNDVLAWIEKQCEQNVADFSQTCKMMTLDEAIEHCKEKSCDDTICGKNHKQLAEWLAELKGYRTSVTQETQKTSDKDEKIRKELMDFIYVTCFPVKDLKKKERFLDWLEKQGKQEPYGKRKECEDCQFNYAGECKGYCALKRNEHKPTDKVEPKFKPGDTMRTLQEASDGYTDGMPVVVSIDNEYYHCTNELIAIKDQDDYEFPPINMKQKSSDEVEPKFHEGDIVQYITDSTDRRKIEEIDTFCNMYHTDSSPIMFEVENEWKVVVNAEDVEQESTNNVEPKFHEGVWVVNKLGDSWHIDSFDEKNYQVSDGKGNYNWFPISKQDEMHLWTIQDAKCGDVLISPNKQPFMYNGNYTSDTIGAYFGLLITGELLIVSSHDKDWTALTGVQPATEEERNALFKKLHDSDYKWDDKKKELWHKYL